MNRPGRTLVTLVATASALGALLALPASAGGSRGSNVEPRPSQGCDTEPAISPGQEKVTMTSGGVERWFHRHVPSSYDGTTPMPLVVDLHGYLEGADVHRMHTRLEDTGEREGFITLTPHGEGVVPRWDVTLGSPDMVFIGDLLDAAERTLCVDVRRVYATGLSNGAFMTSSLACAYADRFAAVAPVAGIRQVDDCEPARSVPTVAFHGTADDFVRFDGGLGSGASRLPNPDGSPRSAETAPSTVPAEPRPTIPDNVAAWAELNGCKPKLRERTIADDVTLMSYRCPRRADVQLYVIEGGGHTWPGSEFSRAIESITGPVTFSIDANDVMWRFFERHPLRSD